MLFFIGTLFRFKKLRFTYALIYPIYSQCSLLITVKSEKLRGDEKEILEKK